MLGDGKLNHIRDFVMLTVLHNSRKGRRRYRHFGPKLQIRHSSREEDLKQQCSSRRNVKKKNDEMKRKQKEIIVPEHLTFQKGEEKKQGIRFMVLSAGD
ncbi:hypothetical protein SLA2020_270460 [Shorea laevis]